METEEYLIEEKSHILALNELSQILEERIKDNYYDIIKGKVTSDFLEEVFALNTAIKAVIYCMRLKRKECYKQIDANYQDNISLN